MVKKYIYCEKKFFDLCMTKIANWNFCEANFEELKLWMCLKETIFANDIILHLDITDDELQLISSKNFKDLTLFERNITNLIIHKQKVGAVIKKNDSFVNIDNIDTTNAKQLTAYYLTCCDSKKCEQYMNDYGVLAICPENIMNFKDILCNGTAIKKRELINWNRILHFNPCNSLIFIDNYAFKDQSVIDNNFLQILDTLLPQSWGYEIPFQISVYTSLREDQGKDFFDIIVAKIDQLRDNFFFKFTLFKCVLNNFHDRVILTNNCLIVCGGGFDLIGDNNISSKTTIVNVTIPFFNQSAKWFAKAYSNFIEEVVSVSKNISEFDSNIETKFQNRFYIGDNQNRLIS